MLAKKGGSKMAIIFLLTMICSILLALTGSLPFWTSGVITVLCLAGLMAIGIVEHRKLCHLKRRCRQLQAVWGIPASHLGGLPMPLETPGNLYLLSDELMLDTEHTQHRIELSRLQQILLVTSDQIRKLSDHQLCELLETGGVRSFSLLREKIRHHDSTLTKHGIMMIVYQEDCDEPSLLILSTHLRIPALLQMLSQSELKSRTKLIGSTNKR